MEKIFIIITIIILALGANCTADDAPPNTEEGFLQWFKDQFGDYEISDSTDEIANFIKGKIVDQNGNAVSGAEITSSWFYTSLITMESGVKVQNATTDSDGFFFMQTETYGSPHIREIKKKGYEFSRENNPYFKLSEDEQEALLLRSKDVPILFYLRKLGPTTYLYEYGYNWYVQKKTEVISYDAIARRILEISPDLSKLKKPEFIDLVLSSTHDTAEGTYTVRLTAPLETNGMQVSDTKLYEAPADGYTRELTLTFNHGDEVTKYIYFTSRNPAVYTRMELDCKANPERLTFSFDTWTNPYGSRNLENEPNLPADLLIELSNEAEEALGQGKIPPEPDIPALLASGKYE